MGFTLEGIDTLMAKEQTARGIAQIKKSREYLPTLIDACQSIGFQVDFQIVNLDPLNEQRTLNQSLARVLLPILKKGCEIPLQNPKGEGEKFSHVNYAKVTITKDTATYLDRLAAKCNLGFSVHCKLVDQQLYERVTNHQFLRLKVANLNPPKHLEKAVLTNKPQSKVLVLDGLTPKALAEFVTGLLEVPGFSKSQGLDSFETLIYFKRQIFDQWTNEEIIAMLNLANEEKTNG
jgi:hypothetical protein